MLAACSRTLCAWRTMSSPSGVTVTSLALRSNSLTSSSSSSFLIATERVGCDTKQDSAALPKCFSLATATMYLSSVSVTEFFFSRLEELGFSTQPTRQVAHRQIGVTLQHDRRQGAGPFEPMRVQGQVGKAKQGRTRLPRPQELARAAYFEVTPRDLESIRRLDHRFQPGP